MCAIIMALAHPDQLALAWDEALSSERPVVLEVKTDPEVPPLPPHLALEQVKNLATSFGRTVTAKFYRRRLNAGA